MKTQHLLSAAALAIGALGLQGSAMALTTENGSICQPYGATNTAGLYTYINGIWNYSAGTLSVVCPVVRTVQPASGGSFSVWVDGNAGTGTMYCALYSYDYTGVYKGYASFTATGTFSRLVTLPAAQVPYFSSQSVYCSVPKNGGVFDIEPVQ